MIQSHENPTKTPRNLYESLARPWTVVQDLSILWNFGHQTCARDAKNTRSRDESPARLAVQTRPQSNRLVRRAVFTRDLFVCSAGDPQKPQIIRNENHHLALFDFGMRIIDFLSVAILGGVLGMTSFYVVWSPV